MLDQIEKIKRGNFDDWILKAVINDFKKRQKENYEKNDQRVELLRDTFLAFVDWQTTLDEIKQMEKITKDIIIQVANKYYGENYVVGFGVDTQHDLPLIEKPPIDPLNIDPDKESAFMKEVGKIACEPLTPSFLEEGRDFTVREIGPGIRLVHTLNPINDLFKLETRMEMGFDHSPLLAYTKRMLDRAGAEDIDAQQLKSEWYKLGTDFGFGVREKMLSFSVNGLDENFESSLDLAEKLLLFTEFIR